MKSEFEKITGLEYINHDAFTGDSAIQYLADQFSWDKEKAINTMGFIGKEGYDGDD